MKVRMERRLRRFGPETEVRLARSLNNFITCTYIL